MVKQLSQLYREARKAFLKTETPQEAGYLARNLLCRASGKNTEELLRDENLYANEETCEFMEQATARILNNEPLAYVLGEWEFYGLKLMVNPDVLIPRDDTCAVASLAINHALFLDQDPRILDLCTGSG